MILALVLLAASVQASGKEELFTHAAAQRLFEQIGLGFAPSARSSPVVQDDNPFTLEMIPQDLSKSLHSQCLDGSGYGYYVRRALSPSAQDKWVLYLQGGGLCVTQVDCEARLKGDQVQGSRLAHVAS